MSELEEKAKNNSDPDKWDMNIYAIDAANTMEESFGPFKDMAYPVEPYKYSVASSTLNFEIDAHCFSGKTFGERIPVSKEEYQTQYRATVIIHTGEKHKRIRSMVTSRNAPYLSFQGDLNAIQFAGVYSPDGSGFVLVNMKVFDLRFGKTIIIFPTTENSFYYLQIDQSLQGPEHTETYIESLKVDKKIKSLLNQIRY